MIAHPSQLNSVGAYLRAETGQIHEWMLDRTPVLTRFCIGAIIVGAGIYGAAIGSWREPLQALYTGIKLPLAILLTTLGNGLLNGMLAPLLGLNVTLRQSLALVLFGFAVTALLLGALSPVALFLVWNTPPFTAATRTSAPEYAFLQLILALFVAVAGVTGCLRLWPLLRDWAGKAAAGKVLIAWFAVNLFLGSQICWMLRPFIWEADAPVRFIGHDNLHGSFFETVFEAARRLIFS